MKLLKSDQCGDCFGRVSDAAIKSKIDELERLSPSDIDYDKRLEETVADLVKTIPESNRAALTHYVARRRSVLEIFQKILHRQLAVQKSGGRNADETLLHNLIFQQTSTRPDQSDLWLFNEEFIYYSGSSNVQLRQLEFQGERIMKVGVCGLNPHAPTISSTSYAL